MLCQKCGRDTKEGFPYCSSCGEWIGTSSTRSSAVPGSWGNTSFERRAQAAFVSPTRVADSYRGPALPSGVPAETQRRSEPAPRRAFEPAAAGWMLHWKRA